MGTPYAGITDTGRTVHLLHTCVQQTGYERKCTVECNRLFSSIVVERCSWNANKGENDAYISFSRMTHSSNTPSTPLQSNPLVRLACVFRVQVTQTSLMFGSIYEPTSERYCCWRLASTCLQTCSLLQIEEATGRTEIIPATRIRALLVTCDTEGILHRCQDVL